jgi:hypothetical protein
MKSLLETQNEVALFCVRLDNALKKTLSMFIAINFLRQGAGLGMMIRKWRDDKGKRERHKTDVPCTGQTRDY